MSEDRTRRIDLDPPAPVPEEKKPEGSYKIFAKCTNCDWQGKVYIPKGVAIEIGKPVVIVSCKRCGCETLKRIKPSSKIGTVPPGPAVRPTSPDDAEAVRRALEEFLRRQSDRHTPVIPMPEPQPFTPSPWGQPWTTEPIDNPHWVDAPGRIRIGDPPPDERPIVTFSSRIGVPVDRPNANGDIISAEAMRMAYIQQMADARVSMDVSNYPDRARSVMDAVANGLISHNSARDLMGIRVVDKEPTSPEP